MGTSPIRTHRWRFFPFWIKPARHLIQNGRFGKPGGSVAFPPFWIKLRRRRALDPECAERHSLVAPSPAAENIKHCWLTGYDTGPTRSSSSLLLVLRPRTPQTEDRPRNQWPHTETAEATDPPPPTPNPQHRTPNTENPAFAARFRASHPHAHNQPQRPLSQATEFPSASRPRNLPQVPNLREVRPPPVPTRPERPARVGRAQPSQALRPGPARQIPPLTPCPRMHVLRTKSFELRPDPKDVTPRMW